jgi:hypothetical protein
MENGRDVVGTNRQARLTGASAADCAPGSY